jgi:hypothetical protein
MLQPGTCLLQYYFMGDDLLTWLIDGNGMLFSLLATQSAAELTVAIEKFRGISGHSRTQCVRWTH